MLKASQSFLGSCLSLAVAAAGPALAQAVVTPGPAASPSAGLAVMQTAATPAPAAAPSAGSLPYQLNLLYTGELWTNAQGGLRQGTTYMYNVDARFAVDTERAFGWTGGRFVLEGFYESKNSFNDQFAGAAEEQSSIDSAGFAMFRLYQFYYDQAVGNTDIRFGIYDLETEFSTTRPMLLFLSKNLTWNTALDQSGTMSRNGVVGPGNYPYTPLALRVRETFNDQWSLQAVVANGAADNPNNQAQNGVFFSSQYGALGIGEVDFTPNTRTKLMAGIWGLTSKLPSNDMVNRDGSPRAVYGEEGGYIGGATRLYPLQGRRGLDGFFTFGLSSPATTDVAQSLNGGLVYTGLFDARPADKMGLSFNENANPASYRQAQIATGSRVYRYETSFEATYRARICEWLTMQPDIQYIIHPGYDPTLKNDLVIGLHFEVGHLFEW